MKPIDEAGQAQKLRVLGITGGVGAGKSAVLAFLEQEYHARIIEADRVGHQVMEPDGAAYDAILERFGREILAADGRIDRGRLGAIVFSDKEQLAALNAIVHPAVKAWIREEIERESREGKHTLVVVEAALLIEDHYEELCPELWYIHADDAVRRERLRVTRGYSEEKIDAIFQNQLTDEEFRAHCPVVIENGGSFADTCAQLRKLLGERRAGEKETENT